MLFRSKRSAEAHNDGLQSINCTIEKFHKVTSINSDCDGVWVQKSRRSQRQPHNTFNKIISNNGDLVAEAYSKIGDCYFFPAQIIVEENAKLAIDDPKYNENENKIKELYEKAKPYYEKAKELKPDNKALWGNYLLNIYWKLNRAEYDSLEKELGY